MYIGEVAGRVVSTVKTEGLKNIPLLVVQLIEKGRRTKMIVAADSTGQAGRGDLVYLIRSEDTRLNSSHIATSRMPSSA